MIQQFRFSYLFDENENTNLKLMCQLYLNKC